MSRNLKLKAGDGNSAGPFGTYPIMCCIVTYFGWTIDLIQRIWVFIMSCCISSAVCCVILISSMSGVALGYNYSLSEYMDLKETNVSVFVKRGLFIDEDTDGEFGGRRSDGQEASVGDNSRTQGPLDDNTPVRSGRRLDDSLIESDDHIKFEGALMKLTAKPVYPLTTILPFTSNEKILTMPSQYPQGSLDQLKAIQNLISMRKAGFARDTTAKRLEKSNWVQDERNRFPVQGDQDQARRGMPLGGLERGTPAPGDNVPSDINPARFAVPDASINEQWKWMGPKIPSMKKYMNDESQTYPHPIIYNSGPIRPTRLLKPAPTPTSTEAVRNALKPGKAPMDLDMEEFKNKLILEQYESPRQKNKEENKGSLKSGFEYYEDDIKGLPVRRRKSANRIKRKVPRAAVHQKLLSPESTLDKSKENSVTNQIRSPVVLSSRLLRSNLPWQSFKSKINLSESDVHSTTDRIVRIIQSMFS